MARYIGTPVPGRAFRGNRVTHILRLLDNTRSTASASAAAEEDMLFYLNALLLQYGISGVDIFLRDDLGLAYFELGYF